MQFVLRALWICVAWVGVTVSASAQPQPPIHILMRAFIPKSLQSPANYIKKTSSGTSVIPAPGINVAGVNLGYLSGTCFTTDDRDFATDIVASARITVEFNIAFQGRREISVEKVDGREIVRVGETHNVDCISGKDLKPPQREELTSVQVGTVRKNGFLRIFNVKGMSGNPFYRIAGVGIAPKIDMEVVFEYNPLTLTLDLHGVIGTFPAFEGYYNGKGESAKTIVQMPPEAGATAINLLDLGTGINTRNFNATIDLKPYLL